jgi:hypothetical protein
MTSTIIYPQITPYVYKITNKETGEFYIGSRVANVKLELTPEEDFGVVYFTSGKLEKQFKQNPNLFKTQIIYRYDDYNVCYWYEQLTIRENIKDEKCINGRYNDPDNSKEIFSPTGSTRSCKMKERLSQLNSGINNPNYGMKWSDKRREKYLKTYQTRIASGEIIYTKERMQKVRDAYKKSYKITLTDKSEHFTDNLTKWCDENKISLTCMRVALDNEDGVYRSKHAQGFRGKNIRSSKHDGIKIEYK